MDFELTDEQRVLREVSRSMLAASCPPQLVRSLAASGQDLDEKLWQRGAELGWLGMAVPEEHDGAGQGLVELCLVAEELGRAVAPGPVAETALVALALAQSLQRSPSDALAEIVAGLAEGRLRANWAGQGEVSASEQGGSLVLTGRATAVQAAATTDWLLVTAQPVDPSAGRCLALVETARATVTPRRTLDETRRWYDVTLHGVPAQLVTADEAQVRWLQDASAVLTAADALGAGGWLLDATVEYVKIRQQFDRPLGSFQSVKHKAADMLTTLKGATAATYYAAMALDAQAPDATLAASVAKAFTTEGVSAVASEALQTHGGIGFTWEHDLHLYLRRAKVDELIQGTPTEHFARIATLIEH